MKKILLIAICTLGFSPNSFAMDDDDAIVNAPVSRFSFSPKPDRTERFTYKGCPALKGCFEYLIFYSYPTKDKRFSPDGVIPIDFSVQTQWAQLELYKHPSGQIAIKGLTVSEETAPDLVYFFFDSTYGSAVLQQLGLSAPSSSLPLGQMIGRHCIRQGGA